MSGSAPDLEVAWNPEYLREGHAVADTLAPDRLVFGVASDEAESLLRAVYARPIAAGTPVIITDHPTAELVKVAANAFLATKISFINAMAEVCEATGADVITLADAIGHDDRIGRKFLNAGIGFGGGCLPKDIRAFAARAGELGADQALTDSPALNVAAQARLQVADVVVTDPAAVDNAKALWPDLAYAATAEEACTGADVVLLLTEWPQYSGLEPVALGELPRARNIIDARNALDPGTWLAAGWNYRAASGDRHPTPADSNGR